MSFHAYRGQRPRIADGCFIDDSARVIGDVEIGAQSSVWFNAVVRGDVEVIRIGRRTNLQDLCMVHVNHGGFSTHLGDDVTVGHSAVLHGCRIGHRVLVGIGAILLDGVHVEDDCVIAAGALLTPGTHIPAGSMVMGSPAKVKRALTDSERAFLPQSAANYVRYAADYRMGQGT